MTDLKFLVITARVWRNGSDHPYPSSSHFPSLYTQGPSQNLAKGCNILHPWKSGSNVSGHGWTGCTVVLFHKHQADHKGSPSRSHNPVPPRRTDDKGSSPRGHNPVPPRRRKKLLDRESHIQKSFNFWSLQQVLVVVTPPLPKRHQAPGSPMFSN